MRNNKIVGRVEECGRLEECLGASSAQLIIVYGRRRVGKTFLVNEFFDNSFAFKLTGTFEGDKVVQLRNFTIALDRMTQRKNNVPKDWTEAFDSLRDYLASLPSDEKQVVFFDEMPWLDSQKSGFLPAFEWFWNDWASTMDNLVFIVCGSATSWMDEKIANNKGGLFNRHTCRIYLKPFNLSEVREFLEKKGIIWSLYDIVRCYMVMGGIPYYLNLLSSRLSLSQNIDSLFFSVGGSLWDEFDHLYRTLFSNSESYIRVVEALSSKTGGLTRNEIIEIIRNPSNGDLTKILNDLVLSGFVRVTGFYGNKKKDALYQLADYYSSFYFRFIKDRFGKDENYWSNSTDNPARRSWEGLVFEQVCKDHVAQIKRKIGISGVLSEESSWFSKGDGECKPGAQIDLLIARRDKVISICEIKFCNGEFSVDAEYDMRLRNKIETFRSATGCRESIQLVMVTTYGVKANKYSSQIQNQVTMEDLFVE
ncbi:MAG: AAA family ATPase [Spirochaetales bacterium]|nr:AAA family ATPase [Spirochaetales bacterium]